MPIGDLLAWMVAAPIAAMLAWFVAEVAFGLRKLPPPASLPHAALTIVVPAHEEAAGIAAMLADLTGNVPASAILVIADNCRDATAEIARGAGVRVIERTDPARPGKGHALACARDALRTDPPLAVMVLDADCTIASGKPALLAARAVAERCPIQAENVQVVRDAVASPLERIGAFAFLVMNLVRARGLERLGGGAMLQGTGMVFPWAVFDSLNLATGSAVEDTALTIALAHRDIPVRLDPRCRVVSHSTGARDHLAQRSRWERGFVRSMRHSGPLLASGFTAPSRLRSAIGLHMMVPPLALLLLLAVAGLGTTTLAALVGWAGPAPAATIVIALAAMAAAVGGAWVSAGRNTVSARQLALAPLYVLWKVPLYLRLLRRGPVEWTRSRRSADPEC